MPRGRAGGPTARRTRATKTTMETAASVGSKRRQKTPQAEGNKDGAPPTKKQKPSTIKASEETEGTLREEPPVATISHHSHKSAAGEVMTLGQGDIGQLGLGEDVLERKKPSAVGGVLAGRSVVQVVCGGMHTAALTGEGQVYTWGCNDESALGRVTEDGEEFSPGLVPVLKDVVQISAGDCHTTALTKTGALFCWGVFRDSNGPFGLVKPAHSSPTPVTVYDSPSDPAIKVVSGSDHVVALTAQGDLYTFGCAEQGQLGRVPECFSSRGGRKGIQYLLEPQIVRFKKSRGLKLTFSDVFCGSYTTFAYAKSGQIYAWGLNNYGQLGVNDSELRFMPDLVVSDWMEGVDEAGRLELCGGQHHSLISQSGSVFVMGRKEYGRLGLGQGSELDPLTPTRLPALSDVASVGAGSVCSFAVDQCGLVYSWGMGTSLQLGTGSEDDVWEPTVITGKRLENRRVLSVCAGGQHTALLVSLQNSS